VEKAIKLGRQRRRRIIIDVENIHTADVIAGLSK